jgi:hypothetical protein
MRFELIRKFPNKILRYLKNLNLFSSIPPSTDHYELKTQTISTWLFIVSLALSMTILLVYTSAVTVTKTLTIKAPTLNQYTELYIKYPETLICPCTQIAINYDKFLHINYTLHQVCSSSFVTNDWINYLVFSGISSGGLNVYDFRATAPLIFEALSSLCELVNETISNSLSRVYETQYVTIHITPSVLLQSQAQAIVSQFQSSMVNQFLLFLSIVRDVVQTNGLLSSVLSNAGFYVISGTSILVTFPESYDNCSCSQSSACIQQSGVYNGPSSQVLYIVPGMYTGCYVIETLLQSSLECFYDQTCFHNLTTYRSPSSPLNATVMNSSAPSQFSTTSTVGELLNNLMVEQWKWASTYADYFDECHPVECSYTFKTRNDVISIVTTLISLVGGLTRALRLVIPLVVNVVRYLQRRIFRITPNTIHHQG